MFAPSCCICDATFCSDDATTLSTATSADTPRATINSAVMLCPGRRNISFHTIEWNLMDDPFVGCDSKPPIKVVEKNDLSTAAWSCDSAAWWALICVGTYDYFFWHLLQLHLPDLCNS